MWPAGLVLGLAFATPALARNEVTRLFADSAPLTIEISGPIGIIVRWAERSTDPQDAMVTANGEALAIQLAARGLTRRQRDVCRFPPLRVRFKEKPAAGSLFAGQRRIKLVTHCRDNSQYEQLMLKEYAAYRLYNRITDESLKVRLARIRYLDRDKLVAERWGFFIEDIDDAARRLGKQHVDDVDLPRTALDLEDAARFSLFEFMIGNLDWDMTRGPKKDGCCHNARLRAPLGAARVAITPVPYDFDYSGLVDAPYAVPPAALPVGRVTQRLYRGLCLHNEETRRLALRFGVNRAALEAELDGIPGLEDRTRSAMKSFLAEFFTDIASPAFVEDKLIRVCR